MVPGVGASESDIGLTLPSTVNTIAGDQVTLPATYTTRRRVMAITWHKMDAKTTERTLIYSYYPQEDARESFGPYIGRTNLVGKASLTISPTTPEDEGKYVVMILAKGAGSAEGVVKLSVMVPPTVRVGPLENYVISFGRTASLQCVVTGAKPNITLLYWEKDGLRISTSSRYSRKYSGGTLDNPNLRISHVTREDAGKYSCLVQHPVSNIKATMKMKVLYPASIISISESVTAMVSDTVTIQCVADGDPTPNITWSKNGRRLRSQSSVMSRDVVVASVRVSKVRVNDSGTYLCKANNGVGGDSTKSLTLTIQQLKRRVPFSTLAVIVGATAGGLWLVVCVGFAIYCARRRKREKEKKKFAFYYNIGRRQPGVGDTTTEDDKEPPPYSAMPAKPDNKASSYGGINTIRKSIGRKDRRYARAMFAYRPREDNELPLETDDVIEVLEGEDGGWCLGYLRGRIGLFPSNYVKFVTTSEVLAMKSGATCQMVALQETLPDTCSAPLYDSTRVDRTHVPAGDTSNGRALTGNLMDVGRLARALEIENKLSARDIGARRVKPKVPCAFEQFMDIEPLHFSCSPLTGA
ncbi:hypothetical protein Bbelb_338570 [Branchiostoma belcheri]|nr:hypothetical protein Bbelb_338570 [Branchiostoma belcheri]